MRNLGSRSRSRFTLSSVLSLALLPAATLAGSIGPSPYLSFADSPFNGASFSYFHLETFEDGALNTSGVSVNSGPVVLGPAPLTDSVDEDDGSIDGSGTGGHSLFANAATASMTFTFDATSLGALPTHVGIVWTDVGSSSPFAGVDNVTLEAFGPLGNSLGTLGPFLLGDGVVTGGTAEDRFLGWTDPAGISKVTISSAQSTDWEVDHLQYGRTPGQNVPENGPGIFGLAALLAFGTIPTLWRSRS